MVDNAAILESIQGAIDENGADMVVTKTASDGSTSSSTVRCFRKRVVSASDSDIRSDSGVDLGDSELIVEASADIAAGDLIDVFGVPHVVRSPVVPINPLGTTFAWSFMARRLES